jgi:hypothetical protein
MTGMAIYDDKTVIELIETRFPSLSKDLREEDLDGLLHCQIGVFAQFAQSVIDDGDRATWKDISQAFWEIWRSCTPDVENALNVSFLEHLNFEDQKKKRSWAYQAMHPAMRQAWEDMEDYNRKLRGG